MGDHQPFKEKNWEMRGDFSPWLTRLIPLTILEHAINFIVFSTFLIFHSFCLFLCLLHLFLSLFVLCCRLNCRAEKYK